MTAAQAIKIAIIEQARGDVDEIDIPDEVTAENADEVYSLLVDEDAHWDYEEEFRGTWDAETEIECDWSRHYESKSVARKLGDAWIGWTYWYGGGKHGEPESIDWIDDAYFLDVTETEKVVVVREFAKREEATA